MTEVWKTVGCVPDSDDEDLEFGGLGDSFNSARTAASVTILDRSLNGDLDGEKEQRKDQARRIDESVDGRDHGDSDSGDELALPAPSLLSAAARSKTQQQARSRTPNGSQMLHELPGLSDPIKLPSTAVQPAVLSREEGYELSDPSITDRQRHGQRSPTQTQPAKLWIQVPARIAKEDSKGTEAGETKKSDLGSQGNTDSEERWQTVSSVADAPSSSGRQEPVLTNSILDADASPPDSPLSSLSSDSAKWDDFRLDTEPRLPNANDDQDPAMTTLIDPEAMAELERRYAGIRSLRKRNPIQLHPYLLEGEQYKRTMHSRGIQAVRMRQERNEHKSRNENDGNGDGDDTQAFQPSSQASSAGASQLEMLEANETQLDQVDQNDSVVPRLDDIFTHQRSRLSRPKKRRKVSHDISERLTHEHPLNRPRKEQAVGGMSTSLPTPGQSDEIEGPRVLTPRISVPSAPRNGFRIPPGTSLLQLQTPAKSPQNAQEPRSLPSSPPESPDIVPMSVSRGRRTITIEESEGSEESEQDVSPSKPTNRRATNLQKRTRGVLPASWTTINLQPDQQIRQAQNGTSEQAQVAQEQQKGVAKRLNSSFKRLKNSGVVESSIIQVFSDEEDEDGPPLPPLQDSERQVDSLAATEKNYIWPDSDDMEDNTIDTMAGAAPTQHKEKKRNPASKPRQKRLKQTKMPSHLPQQRRVSQPRKLRQPRRLGVLDINNEIRNAPNFIRVAARTARAHPTQGRTSPSRKAFRLQNKVDQKELQTTLNEWRNDFQSDDDSQVDKGDSHRRPLIPISSNEQRGLPNPQFTKAQGRGRSDQRPKKPGRESNADASAPHARQLRSADNMGRALQYAAAKADIIKSMKTRHSDTTLQRQQTRRGVLAAATTQYPVGPAQLSTVAVDNAEHSRLRFAHNARPLQVDVVYASASMVEDEHQTQAQQVLAEANDSGNSRDRPARKRRPRQARISAFQDSDSDSAPTIDTDIMQRQGLEHSDGSPLAGLASAQTSHSLCFGIEALPSGPHFGHDSFVGSGRFLSCLSMTGESSSTNMKLIAGGLISSWGVWNDKVREEMSDQFNRVLQLYSTYSDSPLDEGHHNASTILEDIAGYLTERVCFADVVDRNQLLQAAMLALQELIEGIQDESQRPGGAVRHQRSVFVSQVLSRVALVAHQLQIISKHHVVRSDIRAESASFLSTVMRTASDCFAGTLMNELQRFLKTRGDLGSHSLKATDPRSSTAESFVIVSSIARAHATVMGSIWNHLSRTRVLNTKDIPTDIMKLVIATLEQRWHAIYTFLPLIDLNEKGNKDFRPTSLRNAFDWVLVKRLTKPILDVYELGLTASLPAFNRYCRLLFRRCFDLIDRWEWRGCDSIVGFLFDFFARNQLANLRNEPSHGSPEFLQNLRDDLRLSLTESDLCFDILLKIIGTGIKRMREFAPEKKVRDLIWRLIPNHDRRHPKDQEVRQEDLDATRNHHNLLCTLFWAAPTSQRPSLRLIRNLVEEEGSHRQAYHTNIRAWSNLVRYQIASDCSRSSLEPFNEWSTDLLDRLLRQHALARTEVEMQVQQSKDARGILVDYATQEKAIESNQKQVEAIIQDLLLSLKSAIEACPGPESSSVLLCQSLANLLGLNKARHSRIDKNIMVALQTIQATVRVPEKSSSSVPSQSNVDSQGLDWTIFEDGPTLPDETTSLPVLDNSLYSALHSLLLSCLNDQWTRPDDFLTILTETWALIALRCVETRQKSWDNFLGPYGHDTWDVIGDTANKRRYTPFFLSYLIEHNFLIYEQQSEILLGSWIESLVERESQVKYQGRFTASLLEAARNEPLLDNLPFAKNPVDRYAIPMEMFIQRRVLLLGSVFSNMRVAVSEEACPDRALRSERLSHYQDLLKRLMSTMKARFQELGEENEAQSAYVTFVHAVVRALQEHVQNICQVDPFFTSSALFPLPAGDPTYVTSKIRAYGLRLHERSVPKQLAVFLQATIERAVHDGQQGELVRWIAEAGSATGDKTADGGLRAFILQPIISAYAAGLIRTACGWLLAEPVFEAAKRMLGSMADNLDGCDSAQTRMVAGILESILGMLLESCGHALSQSQESYSVLIIHTLDIATTMLPLIDYLMQLDVVERDSGLERRFKEIILLVDRRHAQHEGRSEGRLPTFQPTKILQLHRAHDDIKEFALKEVQDSLQRFKYESGQYYARRNTAWKVISVDARESLSTPAVRQQKEQARITQFDAMVDRLPCVSEIALAAILSDAAALDSSSGSQ